MLHNEFADNDLVQMEIDLESKELVGKRICPEDAFSAGKLLKQIVEDSSEMLKP